MVYAGVWVGGAHRDDVFDVTVNAVALVPVALGVTAVRCKMWAP